MRKVLLIVAIAIAVLYLIFCVNRANVLTSPNGTITVEVNDSSMSVVIGQVHAAHVGFGIETNMRKYSGLHLDNMSRPEDVVQDYTMLTGKRSHCHNEGTRVVATFATDNGEKLNVEICAYNNGVAFRYELPTFSNEERIIADNTSYEISDGLRRWMQVYDRQGYENFYPLNTNGINPDRPDNFTWGFPALVELAESSYMLLSESNIRHGHCGSWLVSDSCQTNVYKQQIADEIRTDNTPWRVMILGTLADIVESTLITDVADNCKIEDTSWIEPGVAAWIYWAHNHGSQDYQILCEYADLAKEMGWKYSLIDAEWDVMHNGGNLEDAVKYTCEQGVKPLLWYNSSTNWVGQWAPTPQYLLNKPEDRDNEYRKISEMGISGLKIDFFPGDQQATMDYYLDLLEDAVSYKLSINFHGATIPRGWQRTYPNLMSMEAVYGAEWYNNMPVLTNRAARHNATLPFTRNVVGSMDYTPGTFTDSQHPHITTHAHELALTMLFESGIQHMPDRPEAYRSLPEEVKSLLSALPSAWDDTKFICGYPGESAVIARRKGDKWWIAGINGLDEKQTLSIDLSSLGISNAKALKITDGESQTDFNIGNVEINSDNQKFDVECAPRGGFVITL